MPGRHISKLLGTTTDSGLSEGKQWVCRVDDHDHGLHNSGRCIEFESELAGM